MAKNYKDPDSRFATVEWSVFCPVESYSISRSISATDDESIDNHVEVLIDARIRYPEELAGNRIQVQFWRCLEPIVGKDNPPYKGIGGLSFIEKTDYSDESCFVVSQPAQPTFFEEVIKSLLESESATHVRREIHLKVVGLLNEWDRTGELEVTKLELVLFCSERERQPKHGTVET